MPDIATASVVESTEPRRPSAEPTSPPVAAPLSWLPVDARTVVSLQPAALADQAATRRLLERAAPWWNASVVGFYAALEIRPDQVRRVTWIDPSLTTQAATQPRPSLCVVELRQPIDKVDPWLAKFEKAEPISGSLMAYRAPHGRWPHPFVLLDAQTIATGPIEKLISLVPHTSDEKPERPHAVATLLRSMTLDAPLLIVVDVAAAREADAAELDLPVERWGVRRNDWLVVRDLPRAVGFTLAMHSHEKSTVADPRLTLLCESASEAQQVGAAAEAITSELKHTVNVERQSLVANLSKLPLTMTSADQLDLLLGAAQTSLDTMHCRVHDALVTVETRVSGDLPKLADAALAGTTALEQTRLAAARGDDEQQQRRLLEALDTYRGKENTYPAGVAGTALLDPETRLSWLATLLPYYGRFDWHRELKFGRAWNDVDNQPITRRPLDAVVNPAMGLSMTEAGYPVTQYVGVAGLGADAARLDASDPRAGVFGYHRRVTSDQIADGAGYTIAIAGVSDRLGPWAAGGDSTVRAFTKRPYIDGPDGFGSGQAGGMLVGMADGSVRWINKDVDPEVLEALVTINGHEKVDDRARQSLGWLARATPPVAAPPVVPAAPTPEPAAEAPIVAAPPMPKVDIAARLADPIPAVDFKSVRLSDFIEFLSQMSTLPITFDLDALVEAGVHPDEKITVQLGASNVAKLLDHVLTARGLTYVVQNGQIVVTHPRRKQHTTETVRWDVEDLIAGNQSRGQELIALVTQFVEPGTWSTVGGHGSAKLDGNALVVRQSGPVQPQVEAMLERLRRARGLATKVHDPAERWSLVSRSKQAHSNLATPVTANFREPTPLQRIVDYLQEAAKMQLPIDGMALVAAGRTVQTPAVLVAAELPLSQALDQMLAPLGFAWRAIDEHTIQITSRQALAEHCELEFYRVGDLLTHDTTPAALIERIESSVAPKTWSDLGGVGAIRYDAPSKHLLVWHTQPTQRQVESLLDSLRGK